MKASKLRSVTLTSSYVAFPDIKATRVSILNKTGATMDIRMASETSAGQEINIEDGVSVVIKVVANAKEIEAKSATGTTGVELVIDND